MSALVNLSSGFELANQVSTANTFWSRFLGLLGRKDLPLGQALIITNCRQVHMFGMRFPIDILFCSADNLVLGLVENLSPGQISKAFRSASYVIELPAGTLKRTHTVFGDEIAILENHELTSVTPPKSH